MSETEPNLEAAIEPSDSFTGGEFSGGDFTDRVMAAVRREARAPAPIPFPWRRLAAVAAACIAVSAISLAAVSKTGLPRPLEELGHAASTMPPGTVALAASGILLLCGLIALTARLASR